MVRTVGIGIQDFSKIIENDYFMWIKQPLSRSGGKAETR